MIPTTLDKPMRRPAPGSEEASRFLDRLQKLSSDHAISLSNDTLCVEAARMWPKLDILLLDIQREMSRPSASNEMAANMNELMHAFWQIRNRLLEYVDRGRTLIEANPNS